MELYSKLSRRPKLFYQCCGVSLTEFNRLLPEIQAADAQAEATRKSSVVQTGSPRQRKPGGGPNYACSFEDRLLMLLLYYRLYVTQEFLTLLFAVKDKSTICRGIQRVRPLFEQVLPVPERLRQQLIRLAAAEKKRRGKRIGDIDQFQQAYPELSILIDGVEQPKRRRSTPAKNKDDYSGRKKRHTRKQIIHTTANGMILHQSASAGGRTHDSTLFQQDEAGRQALRQFSDVARVHGYFDSGFFHLDQYDVPMQVHQMQRAWRNRSLTPQQRQINRVIASRRVAVEHAIAQRKNYKIAALRWRNPEQDYERTMLIVAGLVNLRALERLETQTGLRP